MNKLEEIFAYKRSLEQQYMKMASTVEAKILSPELCPFKSNESIKIIAEIKRSSPSCSNINLNAEIKAKAIVYEASKVAMISVLTEDRYFSGSYSDLYNIKSQVNLPLLNKDFIFSKAQIQLARHFGASFILLITTMLSQEELFELYSETKALGMEAIFEIHNLEDYKKIKGTNVPYVGINNRNLKTMKVDIKNSLNLIPIMDSTHHLISESGIQNVNHIRTLYNAGIDSFLIGEVLMRSENPHNLIKSFQAVAYET